MSIEEKVENLRAELAELVASARDIGIEADDLIQAVKENISDLY